HVYERSLHYANVCTFDCDLLDRAIEEMTAEGIKDLLGEGIDPQGMECSLELEVSCTGQHAVMLSCPDDARRTPEDLRTFLETQLEASAPSLRLNLARLRVTKGTPRPRLVEQPLQLADPSPALTGSRQVAMANSRQEARLYAWELLRSGNRVDGCAVIEGPNTTYFVPEGWTLVLDQYGNAKVTRQP